jgi:hypothetical protein
LLSQVGVFIDVDFYKCDGVRCHFGDLICDWTQPSAVRSPRRREQGHQRLLAFFDILEHFGPLLC